MNIESLISKGENVEVNNMKDFNKVAIINYNADYSGQDHAVALYDDEAELIGWNNLVYTPPVIVNDSKMKDRIIVAYVLNVISIEDYNRHYDGEIIGEVVGVVNMSGYNRRIAESKRLRELPQKKAEIVREFEQEIDKYKTVTYYEDMAKKYPNNSRLQDLVNKLIELGG